MRRGAVLSVAVAGALLAAGGVTASALLDLPQDAQSVTADLNRQQAQPPTPPPAPATAPVEAAPAGDPAPSQPVAVVPPVADEEIAAAEEDLEAEAEETASSTEAAPAPTGRRQRRRVAVVHAVNKVTAQSMTFAVQVGGRPVRFSDNLIISARACDVSASDEPEEDSIAYLEIGILPRGVLRQTTARQVFRGWMFASTPGVNGLEHPLYDAWVVACRA